MKVEIRADGIHISGYVNVPGRESRPVMTKHGKVVEVIEQRAFQRAIDAAANIDLKLDHERTIASTGDKTLTVYEDAVGLRAEAIVTDLETVEGAKAGKLKGWSFNMMNVKDTVEERAGQLPLRKVTDFKMSEITLALKRNPVYSSTSLEVRAETEETATEIEIEIRTEDNKVTTVDLSKKPNKKADLAAYRHRINKLKVGK